MPDATDIPTTSAGPLAGVRVLDLTNNLSGPYGTLILAQQGADVVKVERPPRGDILRGVGSTRGGVAAYFVNTNWGKRSIALDLRDEDDAAVMAWAANSPVALSTTACCTRFGVPSLRSACTDANPVMAWITWS